MKILLLLSGGIDSPVAGHLLKQQGAEIVALHFSMEPIVDDTAEKKSITIAEKLGFTPFYTVPFGTTLAHLASTCTHKYYFVIMRRIMYRVATQIVKRLQCDTFATGENLGQVGSQTLDNLAVIDRATDVLVLRPILCNDKVETIRVARDIGTFEISKGPEMCAVLGPKHPVTRAQLDRVLAEEQKLDMPKIVAELVEKTLAHTPLPHA